MYRYNATDTKIVNERVAQFRDQVRRRLSGELSEQEFLPLRLMNGLYKQRYAYMLRVAIPYGLLSSKQVRCLAMLARDYDKGFGHFTTRQNIQYNWPELEDVPDMLQHLADVEMHAIQTSGNCVRNISADHFAGVALDEAVDPRPYCEIMRQWSTFHPEFSYLPRKFKLAFTGATDDRAAIAFHDIGYRVRCDDAGNVGFQVWVGGGLGRTPVVGQVIHEFVPEKDILNYTESILRVYNMQGDRQNKFKARIKILVKRMGLEAFKAAVEADFEATKTRELELTEQQVADMFAFFAPPAYREDAPSADAAVAAKRAENADFDKWVKYNVKPHKVPGYHAVVLSLKYPGTPPGDLTDTQMEAVADLADEYNFGEVRVLHTQNLLFAHVESKDLYALWQQLRLLKVAEPNVDQLTDMICCPGLDFCDLANATSIPIAEAIAKTFDDYDYIHDLGELKVKMSGCINACGHHHIGHIGILGIDRKGEEYYQIMLGGAEGNDASLGKFIGRAFPKDQVVDAVRNILAVYVEQREEGERLLDTYRRTGVAPFAERCYD